MGDDSRRHHRIMTFIPIGIQFVDGNAAEGWGRIKNISIGGLEMETHFALRNAQKLYLTFNVEGVYQFQHVPARVVRARNLAGIFVAGISFDEALDREHLREAIVHLINRI